MKTKNTKRTFIIFQILAVIFLLLGFAGRILQNQDYDLLLFGRPILFQAFMICFLIFYFIEALTIWRLFEKIKKKLFQHEYPNEDYVWMCRSVKYCEDGSNWLLYEDLEKKRKEDKKKGKI